MPKVLPFPDPVQAATTWLMRRWRQRSLESALVALARMPWRTSERAKVLRLVAQLEASSNG